MDVYGRLLGCKSTESHEQDKIDVMSVAPKGLQRVAVSDSGYVIIRRQHDAHDDGPLCESSLVTTSSTYTMFFSRAQLGRTQR